MARILFWPVLGLALVLAACGANRDMLREWQRHESAYYQEYVNSAQGKGIAPEPLGNDFEKEVAKLQEMRKRWDGALKAVEEGKEEVFFTPPPSRFKALLPAGNNPTAAAEALSHEFSLEDLEILAVLRNPGVKASEDSLRGTIETYSQVWNLDEILRQYTAFTADLMTGIGPAKGREPIQMKFPFPGVLALKGEIVTQEVKASRETLDIARRTAVTLARKSFWSLLFVRRSQQITGQMLELLKHLEAVATNRYETGKTSFQDMIKIRIERDKLGEELKTLEQRQRNLEVKILEIVNLPPETAVGLPVAQPPSRQIQPPETLYALALTNRQELKQLRASVGKMEQMIAMAETAIYPVYSLNLSLYANEPIKQVGTARTREPFATTTTASMGAGLPKLPWYGTNDAYLRETRQKLRALREELKGAEDQTFFAVREAWFGVDRALREEALYDDRVVKLSEAALEVSTRGYETGKVSFADVINSYTGWLKDKLALEKERSDLGVAQADLDQALGTSRRQ